MGVLHHLASEGEIVFLDGNAKELFRQPINRHHQTVQIPSALWHKIASVSDDFSAELKFYCQPHRYFSKKHKLGNVHSDLLYFDELYHHYQDRGWSVLEYKERVGQLHKLDISGKPIKKLFGLLIAKKCA